MLRTLLLVMSMMTTVVGTVIPSTNASLDSEVASTTENETVNTTESSSADSLNEGIIGRWEGTGYIVKDGTGSSFDGVRFDPSGEWVEFNEDNKGTLFILKEFPFSYTIDGDTIHIQEDVGLEFEGKLEGDELVLDNGPMLYYYKRGESEETEKSEKAEESEELEESEEVASVYSAISCTSDGENNYIEGEGVVFYPNGEGIVRFGKTNYDIEWTLEEDVLNFVDASGDSFTGTCKGNNIIGVYSVAFDTGNKKEYKYVYEFSNIEAIPTEDPSVYESMSCTLNGKDSFYEGESITLYSNGTGTVMFADSEYDIIWSQNDDKFAFFDNTGSSFEGTIDGGLIIGEYTVLYQDWITKTYKYVYSLIQE